MVLGLVALVGAAAGVSRYRFARTHVVTDNAQVDGHITPIAPKVQAFVARVLVDDNQKVRAGDTLLVLDERDLRVRVTEAEAELRSAQAVAGTAVRRRRGHRRAGRGAVQRQRRGSVGRGRGGRRAKGLGGPHPLPDPRRAESDLGAAARPGAVGLRQRPRRGGRRGQTGGRRRQHGAGRRVGSDRGGRAHRRRAGRAGETRSSS
jgi:hypothetical protein